MNLNVMDNHALLWFLFNMISVGVLAFYSMMEMACVSFNKVRLQYYVSKGYKRAIWLNNLLQNPAKLFGTTLIGVNIALVVGAECSRECYSALGLDPDLAPITQIFLVVILGELAPMFAARHYAEHVTMLGIPIIYASTKIMAPLLWLVSLVTQMCTFFIGKHSTEVNIYLTQDELQKVIEEHSEESSINTDSRGFKAIAANIFGLRNQMVKEIMEPLAAAITLPSNATVAQMETALSHTRADYVLLYNGDVTNIIGIAYPCDLLRASETQRIRDYGHPPWFVTETITIMQILKQFRSNNESAAVVLNKFGKAVGLVKLDNVLEELFGKIAFSELSGARQHKKSMLIDKSFPGNMTVGEFNAQFGVLLSQDPTLTLADLITNSLSNRPEKNNSIFISPFELTVKECVGSEIKIVNISTCV